MAVYLIYHENDTHVVEADNQLTAVEAWVYFEKTKNSDFKISDFSIEEIKTKYNVIRVQD